MILSTWAQTTAGGQHGCSVASDRQAAGGQKRGRGASKRGFRVERTRASTARRGRTIFWFSALNSKGVAALLFGVSRCCATKRTRSGTRSGDLFSPRQPASGQGGRAHAPRSPRWRSPCRSTQPARRRPSRAAQRRPLPMPQSACWPLRAQARRPGPATAACLPPSVRHAPGARASVIGP